MLQNSKVTAFTVSELLKENQERGKITTLPTQIRVKAFQLFGAAHAFPKNKDLNKMRNMRNIICIIKKTSVSEQFIILCAKDVFKNLYKCKKFVKCPLLALKLFSSNERTAER